MKHKAFKFLLLPTAQQEQQLIQLAGISRWIWNYMLQKNKETYNLEKKFIFKFAMNNLLPDLKKEFPWIGQMPSKELRQKCSDLDAAMSVRNWGIEKIIGQRSVQIYACGDTSNGDSEQSESSYVSENQENIPSLEGKRSVL